MVEEAISKVAAARSINLFIIEKLFLFLVNLRDLLDGVLWAIISG
jgi:hypothetical protein